MVGPCPLCGSDVIAGGTQYGCMRRKEGCPFVVWRTMSQRTIPVTMIRALLKEGLPKNLWVEMGNILPGRQDLFDD